MVVAGGRMVKKAKG